MGTLVLAGILAAHVGRWTCADGVPGAGVYRDVCGPPRGVAYLIGHAGLGFAPLYRAWRAGELHAGLPAWYDGRRYALASVRVIERDAAAAALAWAPGPASLRLQFCANASSSRVVLASFVPAPAPRPAPRPAPVPAPRRPWFHWGPVPV